MCFGGCGPEVASTGATPSHSSFFGFKPAFFPAAAEVVGSYCCSRRSGPVGFLRLCSPGWLSTIPAGANGFLGNGASLNHSQAQGYPATCFFPVPRAVYGSSVALQKRLAGLTKLQKAGETSRMTKESCLSRGLRSSLYLPSTSLFLWSSTPTFPCLFPAHLQARPY